MQDTKGSINELETLGFTVISEGLKKETLERLKQKTNTIFRTEKILDRIGIGNKARLGKNTFTGNLIMKSDIYIDLLQELDTIKKALGVDEYCLSEYFLVSNKYSTEYSPWWHRDHPYSSENINIYGMSSIGFFIPLSEFNEKTGSTMFIPGSHKDPSIEISEKNIHYSNVSPGDIVAYDPRMLHSGGKNMSPQIRHLLIILFNRKELIPGENFLNQFNHLFAKSSIKKMNRVKWERFKPFENFFSRNKNSRHTSFKLIKLMQLVITRILYRKTISFIYFLWTRILYFCVEKSFKGQ